MGTKKDFNGIRIIEPIISQEISNYSRLFIRGCVNGRRRKWSKEALTKDLEEEEAKRRRIMDRFLEKQTAESIRHTMQAQEDLFKHQVRELHRVYNQQKMIMDQLKQRHQYWSTTSNNQKDQTGSRERTGGCSAIDLDPKTTTDHHRIEESELELTLSIGLSSSSTTNNKDIESSTTSFRSSSDNCNNISNNNNNNQESSGPNTPMSSSSTTSLDREKKRPHWLFQGLSINRTS